MGRSLYRIVLAGFSLGILAGCVPIGIDSARDQFGVSTARADAGAAPAAEPELSALDRKEQAVCTTGTQKEPATVQPAMNEQQFVDQKLRCGHYDHLDLDYVHMDWSNIF